MTGPVVVGVFAAALVLAAPTPRARSAAPAARSRFRWRRWRPRAVLVEAASVVAAGVVAPILALATAAVLVARRVGRGRRARRVARIEIERALPDAVDLLGLLVSAGVPPRNAMGLVGPRCRPPVGEAIERVSRRTAAGELFVDAVGRLVDDLGPAARPLVAAVQAAERDGVELAPALHGCGVEARRRQRVMAEESARRLPVLMLFPLVVCVLPAFALLTIVPLVAGAVSGLRLTV